MKLVPPFSGSIWWGIAVYGWIFLLPAICGWFLPSYRGLFTSYGFAFANLDSIKSFYKEDEYITKEEALNLALVDFNKVIELDSNFARGIPFKLRAEMKKQLGKNYCDDMKIYCRITNKCEEYYKQCK